MVPYLLSASAGVLVGVIYAVMGVRSPAPPVIALLGLLGIFAGETGFTLIKAKFFNSTEIKQEK